jgi:DNA-binding NarL/FixJ family response regulator
MNSSSFRKRIVIVEDNQTIRDCFAIIINSVPRYAVINSYDYAENCIKNLAMDKPQIILMDLELPGINGIDAIKAIKEKKKDIEILVITIYEDSDIVFDALKAGASGYITKTSSYAEIIDSLDTLVAGGAPMSTKIARMVVSNFHSNLESPLSPREKDVLEQLAKGKSYTQIADDLFISKETARSHIKTIYSKLEVHKKSDAIRVAKENKFI